MMRTLIALYLTIASAAAATRLKDIAAVEGVRDNQLLGYGLVVGLAGTGDKRQTVFSTQSVANLLERMGVAVSPTAIQVRNTAGVMITATLPPFAQPGTRIDVSVAAMGDATNLQGGMLILSSLRGPDGEVYAVAQGPVVTGGFGAGRGGNTVVMNHPTAGRVPSGAIVERHPPSSPPASPLRLQLHRADFTNAARVAEAINRRFPGESPVAKAENAASVAVRTPSDWTGRPVEFIAELEKLTVERDGRNRVVVNEKTGSIVMGKEVRIAPVAILHGALTVEVRTELTVSQPESFSQGSTVVAPQAAVAVKEEKARNVVLDPGASVDDLVRALMAVGSTARDVIAILQSLVAAGALDAELEVL
jgi:flagellar P-ring protein precursor FlgI